MCSEESAWWRYALKLATSGIKASDLLQNHIEGKNDIVIPAAIKASELIDMLKYINQGKFAQVLHQTITGRNFLTNFKFEFAHMDASYHGARSFVKQAVTLCESVATKLRCEINEAPQPEVKLMEIFMCGISSLLCYLQVNYAGLVLAAPAEDEANLATSIFEELMMGSSDWIDVKPHGEVISAEARSKHIGLRAKARAALSANGEDCYPCIHFPMLLVFARASITLLCNQLETINVNEKVKAVLSSEIALLWRLRCVNAHHRALIGNTETVRSEFLSLLPRLTEAWNAPKVDVSAHPQKTNSIELTGLSDFQEDTGADNTLSESLKSLREAHSNLSTSIVSSEKRWLDRYLTGCTALELNELAGEFWFYGISEQLLDIASIVGGYVAKITGVMGKRTKFQNTSYSQLVLAGATEEEMLKCPFNQSSSQRFSTVLSGTYPYDIPLEDSDDILHHHIQLDNKEDLIVAARQAVTQFCQAIGFDCSANTEQYNSQSFSGFALSLFSDLAQAAIVSAAEHDRKSKPNFAAATEHILAQTSTVIAQYREFCEDVENPEELELEDSKINISHREDAKNNDKEDEPIRSDLPELPSPEACVERLGKVDESKESLKKDEDSEEFKPTRMLINACFEKLPGARPFWGSYFSALTMRSLLESEESRRHLRSLIQLETLIAMYPASSLERLGTKLSHAKALDELRKVRTAGADEANMSVIICKASKVPSNDEIMLRMDGIFSSSVTSWWLLKRTYAELAQLKNMKQTALETYVEIGLWGRVIEAYIELGRGAQAEKMVRSRLPNQGYLPEARSNPTASEVSSVQQDEQACQGPIWPENLPVPLGASEEHIVTSLGSEVMENTVYDRYTSEIAVAGSSADSQSRAGTATSYFDVPEYRLWAFLGDLMDDPVYYLKSWETSNNTFGYAQRQLGKFLLRHKKYQGAVKAFRSALEINNAQPKLWYACGVCYFELFELSQAIDSFSRCVALQPDNGEAWNNIAAAHLFLRNRKSALGALEHATRLLFTNWKVWENYMYCALDLNEPTKALKALERLTNLRGSTDKKTLITVRYSARQAKLQMMALAHITNAAVDDADKYFEKYAKDGDRSQFVTLSGTNNKDTKLESPSVISQKLLSVITMLEDTVAAMKASESSMGGRNRGGGIEAGEANSLTAQIAVEENQKRDIRRLKALGGISEEDDEGEYEEENSSDDEEKVEDESKSPKYAQSSAQKREGPILDKSYGSIATQYHAFLHDCAARLFAANWAFQQAAERRERQANLILSLRGWATHQRLVETVVAIVYEAVRLYSLAQKEALTNSDKELANKMANGSKFFVQRVLSSLQLSERNGEVTKGESFVTLKKAINEVSDILSKLAKKLESEAGPDRLSSKSEPASSYDAYFGSGGYDDWRN